MFVRHGGIDLAYNMQGDLSIRIWYEKIMYTSKFDELPSHLRDLCNTYHWGPFGNNDESCVAAASVEIFVGELFDMDGDTFRITKLGEGRVTAENLATELTRNFSDTNLVAAAIDVKAM